MAMSSEQQIQQCSDLRGAAQDYKRDATQKHKWANMTTTDNRGNILHKPKPKRTSIGMGNRPKMGTHKSKTATALDISSANAEYPTLSFPSTSDESSPSADEDIEAASTMRHPTSGSQILKNALAKAIEKYEDKETAKLVKNEWELVSSDDGEMSPVKRHGKKGNMVPIEDMEYEFV